MNSKRQIVWSRGGGGGKEGEVLVYESMKVVYIATVGF